MKIIFTIEAELDSDVEMNGVLRVLEGLIDRANKYIGGEYMATKSITGKASVEMP